MSAPVPEMVERATVAMLTRQFLRHAERRGMADPQRMAAASVEQLRADHPQHWADALEDTAAAIEAMREPTEDMAAIGADTATDADHYILGATAAADCWRSMIEESLREP